MRAVSLLFHDVFLRDPAESGFNSPGADRYKLSLTAFEAQLAGVARSRSDAPILASDLSGASDSDDLRFLITVDDGGVSYYTVMAERLEARGWRGHCFVTTNQIGQSGFLTPAQIRELDARGHVIGSHSASHPKRFSTCSPAQMQAEWRDSRQALEDILGHAVNTASVPGGYYSKAVARAASNAGIDVLFTSEPTDRLWAERDCLLAGRFTIRHGAPGNMSARFLTPAPWTRLAAGASWKGKALVKPLLGPWYWRVADRLLARRVPRATDALWPPGGADPSMLLGVPERSRRQRTRPTSAG